MKLLTTIVLVGWMGVLFAGSSAVAGDLKTINGKRLKAMMADGQPLVIVDVREPELFAAGRIRGAINIPYNDATPRILKELSPEDRIVFVCHRGPMGDELGRLLDERGYQTVYNLKGGMKKWKGDIVK